MTGNGIARRRWPGVLLAAAVLCPAAMVQAGEGMRVQLPADAALAPLLNEESLFIFALMNLVASHCPGAGLQPGDAQILAAAGQRIVELMEVSTPARQQVYLDAAQEEMRQAGSCTNYEASLAPVVVRLRQLGSRVQAAD